MATGTDLERRRLLRCAVPCAGAVVRVEDRFCSGRMRPGSGGRRLGSPVHTYRASGPDFGSDRGSPVGAAGSVSDYVDGYLPVRAVSDEVLAAAVAAVKAANPRTRKVAKKWMVAAVAYLGDRDLLGFPLEGGDVWTPNSIVWFISERTPTVGQAAKAQYQRALREVAAAVLGPAGFPAAPVVIGARDPQAPYTAANIVTLWGRATGARTEALRNDLTVMVAGGLGAGLTTGDWRVVRGSDVTVDADGVVINVPAGKARAVPVLARWEDTIAEAADRAGDGFLLRPNSSRGDRNLLSRLITVKVSGDNPKLNAQRLRATWIVWHLCARTPLDVLAAAAGIDRGDSGAIARYLRFVPDMAADEARLLLRDARPRGRS